MVALNLQRGYKLTRNFTGVSETRTQILFILFSYPHQASKQFLLWEKKKAFPQKKKSFYIILSGIRMPKLHEPSLGPPGKKKRNFLRSGKFTFRKNLKTRNRNFLYNCKFPLLSRNHNFHTLEVNNVCFPIQGGKTGLFSSSRTGKHCFPALGLENRSSNL